MKLPDFPVLLGINPFLFFLSLFFFLLPPLTTRPELWATIIIIPFLGLLFSSPSLSFSLLALFSSRTVIIIISSPDFFSSSILSGCITALLHYSYTLDLPIATASATASPTLLLLLLLLLTFLSFYFLHPTLRLPVSLPSSYSPLFTHQPLPNTT